MKSIVKKGLWLLSLIMISCSSVKITGIWKSQEDLAIKNKNIVVVSKSEQKGVRVRFETDLAAILNDNGYQSEESFVKFPELKPTDETEDETQLIRYLLNNDIQVVIVSKLIDSKEYREVVETNSPQLRQHIYYDYRYRTFRGFYTYHDNYQYHEYSGTKYILETVIYDLTKSKGRQMICVITSEVDNPSSMETTSKDLSKEILKKIGKKF